MNRDMRGGGNNTAFDTITAAAIVMASNDNRVSQDLPQKKRWSNWLKIYWCFGSYTQTKRIGPSVHVPETSAQSELPQVPSLVPQFAAPPSSPVSFLQSGPPSSIQSPATSLSLTYISANIHSPGPSNIFAIGPYAHETQLVSPPVFSTEPSTAPFTPTTPSSPEVPFARVLGSNHAKDNIVNAASSRYSLMSSYEFQPGSPISHLISPRSAISGSGTSSPFPDHDFGSSNFLHFKIGEPPKFLNSTHDWGSRQESGSLTPKYRDEKEESAEDAMRRLAKKLLAEAVSSSLRRETIVNVNNNKINVGKSDGCADRSGNLDHSTEFNFENVGTKEEKLEEEDANDWSFFPPTKRAV
ncbi:uncharacterized protein At1g76660-like [Impatiens glandulifera]|uniref:uncharacterized protein At1g76660-like n=1 Tax=Impatiens glandulifera TaxID=253017 RepID=UPI001FB0DF06|nr:uncharacterized protein At1g76660-like [Impatiens glandulifera]